MSQSNDVSDKILGDKALKLAALAREAAVLADEIIAADGAAGVDAAAIQHLVSSGTRLFAQKVERDARHFSPLPVPHGVTATEAATLTLELIRAVDLNLFDLSMWAARPRGDEAEDDVRSPFQTL